MKSFGLVILILKVITIIIGWALDPLLRSQQQQVLVCQKAVLNLRNRDNKCFAHAVNAAFSKLTVNLTRLVIPTFITITQVWRNSLLNLKIYHGLKASITYPLMRYCVKTLKTENTVVTLFLTLRVFLDLFTVKCLHINYFSDDSLSQLVHSRSRTADQSFVVRWPCKTKS